MSHSRTEPNRAWDAGLRPDDHVAVLVCEQVEGSLVDWNVCSPIHFIAVSDMRDAVKKKRVDTTEPKGVEEGSEIRMIWPCTGANEYHVSSGARMLLPLLDMRMTRPVCTVI